MSLSVQRRLVLAYAVVLVSGAGLAGAASWGVFRGGGSGGCGAVGTSTQDAARAVTESFVRDVLVRVKPACSVELGTASLTLAGVPLFRTHYPLVAYRFARADSPQTQAVYVVAQPPDGGLQLGAGNVPVTILSVGLAAPDVGQAGYRITLKLDGGRWRVDVVHRVAV
jgi:hypothetical protein